MDIPSQWWTLFHSPELDRLVREALTNSPTLAQATARLKEAQEESNARTGATKYPTVNANVSVQREQVDLATFGVPFPSPPPFSLLNGSVAVSYALDLFGANRRLIEGLNAQAEYQRWQLQAARLMLAGNVVSAAIRQAQLRSQIEITRQMLELQQQQLNITEQRVQAGGLPQYEINRQRTLVEQTRAAVPPLEQQVAVVNHQLAVLIGRARQRPKSRESTWIACSFPMSCRLVFPRRSLARGRTFVPLRPCCIKPARMLDWRPRIFIRRSFFPEASAALEPVLRRAQMYGASERRWHNPSLMVER